ncbi:MAG TPA: hypothetical protein VGG34_12510 [Opitutaceae bacterium]
MYLVQGPTPPINIDHIAYFALANRIRSLHPAHDYWRSISASQTYAVIMAYMYDLTGSYIISLKLILAVITIPFLFSATILFNSFTERRWLSMVFALATATDISFGSNIWGLTDFSASLNRSLPMPLVLLLLAFYFRHPGTKLRFAAYPALVCLSILHLGTYYLLGILACTDFIRLVLGSLQGRRTVPGERLAYLSGIAAAFVANRLFTMVGIGGTSLMVVTAAMGPQRPPDTRISAVQVDPLRWRIDTADIDRLPSWSTDFTPDGAWKLEKLSQPWRNVPYAYISGMGFILAALPLFAFGAFTVIRRWRADGLAAGDRLMLTFGAAVIIASYGLQTLYALVHNLFALYPINFEEVRSVEYICIPAFYFSLVGFDSMLAKRRDHRGQLAVCALIALVAFGRTFQCVRISPRGFRTGLVRLALETGILKAQQTERVLYARQLLGLERSGEKFYYAALPVASWIEANTGKAARILSNRDDLTYLDREIVGSSNTFLNTSNASVKRMYKMAIYLQFDAAVRRHDFEAALAIAKECNAEYMVVPWPVTGAAYSDGEFSVVRMAARG